MKLNNEHAITNSNITTLSALKPMLVSLLFLAIAVFSLPVSGANAQFLGVLPSCDVGSIHSRIISRFSRADRTLWHEGIKINSITEATERAFNIYPDSSINRRYCGAKAYMSDGRYREVHFVIEQNMGLAGFGWNVEYCVKGTDRWYAYDGWCRVVRWR